jgi:adenosylhomocysteine nucleosidase
MFYRNLFQAWLRNLAEQKVRQTVADAAGRAAASSDALAPCQVGLVFALPQESGGLEDSLENLVTIKGQGFTVRRGTLKGRQVVLALSGAGALAAARATGALIAGHRPPLVISAGFCGGLDPRLKRLDIMVPDCVTDIQGNTLEIDVPPELDELAAQPGVQRGRLLTVNQIVRLPSEKRALGEKHQALAVDMESILVVEVCRHYGIPLLAVRVVSDAVDDELPRAVAHLVKQKTTAARWGAALGAILDRPGSVKEMLKLQQNALAASDRLAKFLRSLIERIVPESRNTESE